MAHHKLFAVDDDHRILRLLSRLGNNCGYDVTCISNPIKFEDELDHVRPQLIILDLVMQECDGMELIQTLAKRQWEGHLILLSGMDPVILRMAEQLASYNGLNVQAALQKPFDVDEMIAVLHHCHDLEVLEKEVSHSV